MTVPVEVLDRAVSLAPTGGETRLGIIVPFDFVLDREYWAYAADDVTLLLTRTPMVEGPVGISFAEEVGDDEVVAAAVRDLAPCTPAVTVYGCTSGSFVGGVAGEARLRKRMEQAGATRALTTSGALIEALAACDARRVAVGTPYDAALSRRLVTFLEEAGCEPVSLACLGLGADIERVDHDTVVELTMAASRSSADAVFLSCTNLRTAGFLDELEERAGRPVLSANEVTMWAALRAADALPADLDPRLYGHTLGR